MENYNKVLAILFFFIDRSVDFQNNQSSLSHQCAYILKEMIEYSKTEKGLTHPQYIRYKGLLKSVTESFKWSGNIPSNLWLNIENWENSFPEPAMPEAYEYVG